MRLFLPFAAWLFCLAAGAPALAADSPRQARLSYTRGPGTDRCPDQDAVRSAVAARLGYDPFVAEAELTVSAAVSQGDSGLQAQIELRNAAGEVKGERQLASRQNDCAELASAMELAISIAIDPLSLSRPAPTPVEPPAPVSPSPAPVAQAAAAALLTEPWSFGLDFGALASAGSAPRVVLGGTLGGRLRRGGFSIGLEGRADLPASVPVSGGHASTSLVAASVLPCMDRGTWALCALLSAGALRSSGDGLQDSRRVTTPFAGGGARAAFEAPLADGFSLRAHLDLLGVFTQTTVRVGGAEVWTSPPLCGALGLEVAAHL